MNNIFAGKSTLSLDAARILKNNPNNHFPSSVHCSYYSCYQKLLDILYRALGYTEEQFSTEFETWKTRTKRHGKHEFIIELFYYRIVNKDMVDGKEFKDKLNALKQLRRESDYDSLWVDKTQSDKAFTLAEDVLKNLKKNFKI